MTAPITLPIGTAYEIKQIQNDIAGSGDEVVYTVPTGKFAWHIQTALKNLATVLNLAIKRTHVISDGTFALTTTGTATGSAATEYSALTNTTDYWGNSSVPHNPATVTVAATDHERLLYAGEAIRYTNGSVNTCQTVTIIMEFTVSS